jgi:hypothetical protein
MKPLRCYAAFILGRIDVRTIRVRADDAKIAGQMWNPKHEVRVRVVHLTWRKL